MRVLLRRVNTLPAGGAGFATGILLAAASPSSTIFNVPGESTVLPAAPHDHRCTYAAAPGGMMARSAPRLQDIAPETGNHTTAS